jgi:hypothetical protein
MDAIAAGKITALPADGRHAPVLAEHKHQDAGAGRREAGHLSGSIQVATVASVLWITIRPDHRMAAARWPASDAVVRKGRSLGLMPHPTRCTDRDQAATLSTIGQFDLRRSDRPRKGSARAKPQPVNTGDHGRLLRRDLRPFDARDCDVGRGQNLQRGRRSQQEGMLLSRRTFPFAHNLSSIVDREGIHQKPTNTARIEQSIEIGWCGAIPEDGVPVTNKVVAGPNDLPGIVDAVGSTVYPEVGDSAAAPDDRVVGVIPHNPSSVVDAEGPAVISAWEGTRARRQAGQDRSALMSTPPIGGVTPRQRCAGAVADAHTAVLTPFQPNLRGRYE